MKDKSDNHTYNMPLGWILDCQTPRHLLSKEKSPWMKNIRPTPHGILRKRFGYEIIHDFGGKILGFKRSGSDFAFIIANDGLATDDDTTCSMWDWNMTAGDDKTMDNITPAGADFDTEANWNLCRHYDANTGHIIAACNGVDSLWGYDEDSAAVTEIGDTDVIGNPRFVASYYRRLFVAYTGTTTLLPFQIYWSVVDDASKATGWVAASGAGWQKRPEKDAYITGLAVWNEGLYLGKEGELWQIYPNGAGFVRVNTEHGFEAEHGILSTDRLYFVENGKVFVFPDNLWLSFPVHDNMAATSPGAWADFSATDDEYSQQMVFSTGNRAWVWDKTVGTWAMYEYPGKIKVLGDLPPFQRFLYQETTELLWEKNIILAEDDIISDLVYCVNDRYLAKQVHTYDDDGAPIEMEYDTRWENCEKSQKKRFRKITIQADKSIPEYSAPRVLNTDKPTFDITYDVSNAPRKPLFQTSRKQTITLDDDGEGSCWLDKTYRWITIRVEERSKYRAEIYQIKVEWQPAGEK